MNDNDLVKDAGGYDWGWPSVEMVLANTELSRRLAAGGFSGCGYGIVPSNLPFITLMGSNVRKMRSALALLKEWTKLSGPNAIRIEIAYDGPGYVLAISQQIDLMRWRVSGIDTIRHPLMMATSNIKRMDSRHQMLDQLADYAQQPVAPLWLIVAEMPKDISADRGSHDFGFTPAWDNAILLPGIDVYRRLNDRPQHSMARTAAELKAGVKNDPDRSWPPSPDQSPNGVRISRERRLLASLPKTLHVLRNTGRGAALLEYAEKLGCARWQAEQAICNLRTEDFLAYRPSSTSKQLIMIDAVRRRVLEPASMVVDLTTISNDRLETQVALDSGFLLRRLEPDRDPEKSVAERLLRVRELGYG